MRLILEAVRTGCPIARPIREVDPARVQDSTGRDVHTGIRPVAGPRLRSARVPPRCKHRQTDIPRIERHEAFGLVIP